MDFFASQDLARKKTKWLIIYFALAVLGMIVGIYSILAIAFLATQQGESGAEAPNILSLINPPLFFVVALGVLAVVGCGSLYKIMELRSGGSAVAHSLGGRRLIPNSQDPVERRILNVVEEMALAAGTSVPPVYVLDNEPGINAFAAGYTIDDAVIGVNRGTIETLNRDELQGVIAHEFSHILNGDMRMSLRMIGVLHGIQLIALIGYFVLRGSFFRSNRDNKGAGAIIAIALALLVFGSIGLFFARLIKASVSRQREYLADASAVQFTRNPEGIGGALKMIGATAGGASLKTANAEVASHMFFANMFKTRMIGWLSTHPPLEKRIQAIDPQFTGNFQEYLQARQTGSIIRKREAKPAKPPKTTQPFGMGGKFTPGEAATRFPVDPVLVIAGVGLPDDDDVEYSHALVENIPEIVADAARDLYSARCLVFAILVNPDDNETARTQLEMVNESEGGATLKETLRLLEHSRQLDPVFRLPVFEIVQGTLVGLSEEQYATFRQTIQKMIESDGKVSLFEFFLQHHLLVHLDRHFGIKTSAAVRFKSIYQIQTEICMVIGVLVKAGHEDNAIAEQAFAKSMEVLGQPWGSAQTLHNLKLSNESLAEALTKLAEAAPNIKKSVLLAAASAITFDGKVTVEEAELFRAISESMDCPIPPVVSSEINSMQQKPV